MRSTVIGSMPTLLRARASMLEHAPARWRNGREWCHIGIGTIVARIPDSGDGITDEHRGLLDRGLEPSNRLRVRTGQGSGGATQRRTAPVPTDYFSEFAEYLGTWGTGTGKTRRVIDKTRYQQIVAKLPTINPGAIPSDFAFTLGPETGNDVGLQVMANWVRRDRIAAMLGAASVPLRIRSAAASRVLQGIYQQAKRVKKERGAYIVWQKSRGGFELLAEAVPEQFMVKSTAIDIAILLGQPRAASTRHLRYKPPRNVDLVLATVHTHVHYKQAIINARSTHQGITQSNLRPTMASAVSPADRAGALPGGANVSIYAIDDTHVHRADRGTGKAHNKLSRKLDILVDALEIYSGQRRP